MKHNNLTDINVSTQVREQLTKISEELRISKKTIVSPELFAQFGIFDTEISAYLNEPMIIEALQQVADELNHDMQSLIGNHLSLINNFVQPIVKRVYSHTQCALVFST